MVTVEDPDDEATYRDALEATGYSLRVRELHHRMFRTPERDVHVHVWRAGGVEERRQLLFRDHLRSSPDDRLLYEATKRSLARWYRDANYYAEAKSGVIAEILARAAENEAPSSRVGRGA